MAIKVGSGQWAVGSGQWAVGSGQWAVGSGQWAVGSGQWAVGSGQWAVGIPLFMAGVSGNVTDKTSFKKIVTQHLKSFKAALEARYFVGDAALYVAETIQQLDKQGVVHFSSTR